MKKTGLLLIIIGILFTSLGFTLVKEQILTESLVSDSILLINDSVNTNNVLVDRYNIINEFNEKITKVKKELKRDDYNSLLEEINSISYEDIKNNLLNEISDLENKITEKEKKYSSKENRIVKVSAYTPFCSDGCNGYTANGRYIGNNIYYNDKDYGTVRIVAADKAYPFGTIVRFNNLNYFGEEIYAIVLDRGGAIGNNKKIQFDLLFYTEREANNFGIAKNVSCDILRLGY